MLTFNLPLPRFLLIGVTSVMTACGSSGTSSTMPVSSSSSSSSSIASSSLSESSSVSSSSSSDVSSSVSGNLDACPQNDIPPTQTRIEAECASGHTVSGDSLSAGAALEINGESLSYILNVKTSGLFRLSYRVQGGEQFARWSANIDGEALPLEPVELAAASAQPWQTLTSESFYLSDGIQTLELQFEQPPMALDFLELQYDEPASVSAHVAVSNMGVGINMGNTLDAPYEGEWALKAERVYFEAYKNAGFNHVRIPATWDNHTASSPPYQINAERMARTEQVVDWALAQGFEVILNAHHEHWLDSGDGYKSAENRARFDAIWRQIAEHFANKSPRLIFEILNEPVEMSPAEVNDLNPRILDIIRQSNPNRLVIVAGSGYTPVSSLTEIELPDDEFLIGNFHSYDPWPFAGQCTRSWGSDADKNALAEIYQAASAWATSTGVPVMVNEFGVAHYDFTAPENVCNQEDRLAYLREHVNLAVSNGIAATVWDDGGSFEVYKREENTWHPAKDVLVSPVP
ncbi:cellulase family glycosylhydrolase [Gilvimarinus chinensis]|uniref:cellulase family glycosylhydrolase n=1 Tax=Gilvimarinus chinensis TaxID=396005 RepID=UPI0014613600|nr:cellulase family glycosylhydrolase [Gilvimarinus chinensis]